MYVDPSEPITIERLYLRDEAVCHLCTGMVSLKDASIDHVLPRSRGGADAWENVKLAHLTCNLAKSNKLPGESKALLTRKKVQPVHTQPTDADLDALAYAMAQVMASAWRNRRNRSQAGS